MMGSEDPPNKPVSVPKRRLRAVFAADVANFSGQVSVSETRGFMNLSSVLRVGRDELDRYEGVLISTPGDGLFALFESAVSAVNCALAIQDRLGHQSEAGSMPLRIGIHLGEVLFDGDAPFGETLNIAARLEGLADPGGILVSGAVVDATAARVSATFESRGVPRLKNIPRRIGTFSVKPASCPPSQAVDVADEDQLDHTMRFSRRRSPTVSIDELNEAAAKRESVARIEMVGRPAPERPATSPAPVPAPPAPATPAAQAVEPPPPPPAPAAQPPACAPAPKPVAPEQTNATAAGPAKAAEFDAAQLAAITDALAVHLGPVARIVVARGAATATSMADLLATLEAKIPYDDEVQEFRRRLRSLRPT